jgi:hypothetical protein
MVLALSDLSVDERSVVARQATLPTLIALRAVSHEWRRLAEASWSTRALSNARRNEFREVRKLLRRYDRRRQQPDCHMPDEKALLEWRHFSDIDCSCHAPVREGSVWFESTYPDGCPHRCCRASRAMSIALRVQRRRDRLSAWLAKRTTRWHTLADVEACTLAQKVCSKILRPRVANPPFGGLRPVQLALEKLSSGMTFLQYVGGLPAGSERDGLLETVADALDDRWGAGEDRLGFFGTSFLWDLRREYREENPYRGMKRCKRQVWRRAAEQHGFAVRPDPGPDDPLLMFPVERLADNMLLHRVESVLDGVSDDA